MKYILLLSIVLFSCHGTHQKGEEDYFKEDSAILEHSKIPIADSPAEVPRLIFSGRSGIGLLLCMPHGMVSFIVWNDHKGGKNPYDSGTLEISGDTLGILRDLAKKYDSLLQLKYK